MEDNDVIREVKYGDIEAFSILVEKYHRRLLNFIFRLVGDSDVVEDLGQEVFLSVYKSMKDFDETRGTPFSAWLFITARNRCISELRNRNIAKKVCLDESFELEDGRGTPEDELLETERREALQSSLEQLPEPFRAAILASLEGDSLEEIAVKENISVGTVKSRLFRAREKMKRLLKEYLGGKVYEGI